MNRSRILLIASASMLQSLGCSPKPSEVIGVWRNGSRQYLEVRGDLKGRLTQTATCAPTIDVELSRDPFDTYAIFFGAGQQIHLPVELKAAFAPNEYFCSSNDSLPMCTFCIIEGLSMKCDMTSQGISGFRDKVSHNCTWDRVSTSTSADFPERDPKCPELGDAGACRVIPPKGDASTADTGARADAGTSGDAAVRD